MSIDDPACRGLFADVTTDASGTFTFSGGTIQTALTQVVHMNAVFTQSCLSALNEGRAVDVPGTCANLDRIYGEDPDLSDASCVVAGTSCDCMITVTRTSSSSEAYSVSGNQLVSLAGDEPVDYCVSGNTLKLSTMQEATTGVFTLTR